MVQRSVLNGESSGIDSNVFCEIAIASIADEHTVKMAPGKYQIIFDTGITDSTNWCKITFIRDGSSIPKILLSDAGIISTDSLFMHAEPA